MAMIRLFAKAGDLKRWHAFFRRWRYPVALLVPFYLDCVVALGVSGVLTG
jgi:hypothetical protein